MRFLFLSFTVHLIAIGLLFMRVNKPSETLSKVVERSVVVELESLLSSGPTKSFVRKADKAPVKETIEKALVENKVAVTKDNHELMQDTKAAKAERLAYVEELKLFIEQQKKYPRIALRLKQMGTVKVKLHIDKSGRFHNVRIAKPSSYPVLNKAAVDLLNQLGSFKPLPTNIKSQSNIIIPIAYILKGGV